MQPRPVAPPASALQPKPESAPTLTTPAAEIPPSHRPGRPGLSVEPYFATPGTHPFDAIEWERRDASIVSDTGEVVFEQRDVEMPQAWSQLATNVVVSKYFRGGIDTPDRETSVRQLVHRVTRTIADWGIKDGYFATQADGEHFYRELTFLMVNQMACFNSPVWFNVGIEPRPQCSACFINSVEDTMESILGLAKTEGMLFKYGSGTGTNLSPLRSSRERLSSGGWASGPVSFMKGYDAFASVIKSGGKTRRAAKMQILDVSHPDIMDFIRCKAAEEQKAWALIEQGYDGGFNVPGGAYDSVFFQNSNLSVRASDAFMQAVENDALWHVCAVSERDEHGKQRVLDEYRAQKILRAIAEGTHICGDPGMQFDDTINRWNPCLDTARINSSNPCSEYMFLDDTACNLASLNLMKFRLPATPGEAISGFDIEAFRRACRTLIVAQDILIDNASYPTPAITRNSLDYRPLGLGYANLGALLMSRGLAYDSDEGRAYAATVTALMHGEAYRTSAELAEKVGTFRYYDANRNSFLRVIRQHQEAAARITGDRLPQPLHHAARQVYDEALALGEAHGFRNAQVTVLAPTGTIGFMMDCDTTGVEPDIALVKYKKLVGGGVLKIVNQTVPEALRALGYSEPEIIDIVASIDEHETIETAPHLKPEHLPIFDCAFKAVAGTRSIHYRGHLRMMAAVQPFLSGAISKTVNCPKSATVEEIESVYREAWRLGIKAVAIYRDGSKRTQPLNTGAEKKKAPAPQRPVRRRLADERPAITHKFSIAGNEGYLTVGMYPDGQPGEIFISMAKEGSTISGLMDAFATATSIMLQYGVPLTVLINKFSHARFEPAGFTNNRQIPIAKSIMDYIFRWLGLKFLPVDPGEISAAAGALAAETRVPGSATDSDTTKIRVAAAHAAINRLDAEAAERVAELTPGVRIGADASPAGAPGEPPTRTKNLPLSGFAGVTDRAGYPAGEGPGLRDAASHDHQGAVLGAPADFQPERLAFLNSADAPPCHVCGAIMVRSGACYKCMTCGATSGCS